MTALRVVTTRPTQHNVGHREAGRRADRHLALDGVLAAAWGEVPAHVVNPEAIARWRRP